MAAGAANQTTITDVQIQATLEAVQRRLFNTSSCRRRSAFSRRNNTVATLAVATRSDLEFLTEKCRTVSRPIELGAGIRLFSLLRAVTLYCPRDH